MNEIIEAVEKKVKTYDPNKNTDSEFESTEQIGWFEMITRFMDGKDQIKLIGGLFGSALFGAALPAFCLLFGNMIDGVGQTGADTSSESSGFDQLQTQAVYMVYIGLGVWMFSWAQVSSLALFAESISFKIKMEYFRKCLEKDASFYDV